MKDRRIDDITKLLKVTSSKQEKLFETNGVVEDLKKQVKEFESRYRSALAEKYENEKRIREIIDKFEVTIVKLKIYEKIETSTQKLDVFQVNHNHPMRRRD